MPLFLMSLIPGKNTLDSIKWGVLAVLILGGGVVALVSAFHTPSKVSLAVSAEHAKGNVEKLQFALKEQAEKAAALEALEAGKRQKQAQSVQNAELSARVEKLKAENAELTKPRADDSTPVLLPDDPWLLRVPKNGTATGANRARP
jgi:acyl-CoA reductase-like NAD-dependent aldehyde dehydrogenase